MRVALRLAVPALAVLCLAGCTTRFVKQQVYDVDGIRIYLRSDKGLTRVVEKDHDHPANIASARLAHILSRIDVRHRAEDGGRREGAIATDMLYPMAEGISNALAKANPNQEVVVMAFRKERRLGIFDGEYLTSLVAYVRQGSLFVHLSRLDWEIPSSRRELDLPEPRVGDDFSKFRIQGGEAMTVVDAQAVAIDWRDPVFRRPTRTKILPTGEVVRKTILMESPPEVLDDLPDVPELPAGLTPEQLRDLADIEEARRRGEITEPEYRARKRAVLEQL